MDAVQYYCAEHGRRLAVVLTLMLPFYGLGFMGSWSYCSAGYGGGGGGVTGTQ